MRILHLAGDREDAGGIFSVIRNLHSASLEHGWTHTVWVNAEFSEIRRPSLTYRYSRFICSESPNHFTILWRSILAFFELSNLLKREHFDIIHSHSRGTLLSAVCVARFLRRPIVFTNHAYARRIGLYQWAAREKRVHTVLLTPNMAKHYGLKESPPKVSIISECCADEFFKGPLPARRPPAANQVIRLVGVGNVMRWKKWHLLAEALAELSDVERERIQFSLWGPTPSDLDSKQYDRELRHTILRHRLDRHFLLRGFTHDVRSQIQAADWFVLPSTNEPCSVALIESLAKGIPVLVSSSGGNVDIVQNGKTGLLFSPDNKSDLAAQLRIIINQQVVAVEPELIRQSVAHRSASCVLHHYSTLYQKVQESTG